MEFKAPHSRGAASSTPKAPTLEDITWEDLKLMTDGNNVRPFAWSTHNLLFLPDPISPAIHAKHIPPSAQKSRTPDVSSQSQFYPLRFTLSPPAPILEMSHSYGPATILTLSPQSKYLYAYFPPTQSLAPAGGLACVWEAEDSLDTWNVKDFWHFPSEAGVVAMRWLDEEREWYAQSGPTLRSCRYPHLGPKLHHGHPAFLAVTQDHNVHLYYRPYPPAVDPSQTATLHRFFSSLCVSMLSPTAALQGQPEHIQSHDATLGGKHVCQKAAIGLGYNDWSVLVATRSTLIPSQSRDNDISMTSVMTELLPDGSTRELTPTSWLRSGTWGEEDFIDLCEVEIDLLSEDPCLVTIPLRPIPTPRDHESYLTHLLVTSHPLESLAPAPTTDLAEIHCTFQIVASFLGQNGDAFNPRSRLISWRVSKSGTTPGSRSSSPSRNKTVEQHPSDWGCLQTAQRTLESAVISAAQIWDSAGQILLCKINRSPVAHETQSDCARIGEISIVSSVNLENYHAFEPEPVLRRYNRPIREFPVFVSASPHRTLVCTTSGTQHNPTVSILTAPRWKVGAGNQSGHLRMISSAIALQLRHSSGSDISDITRALWEIIPTTNAGEASAALHGIFKEVFTLLESPLEFDVNQPWLTDFIGVLLVVYRSSPFKEMRSRWKTASEICQLYASVRALDDSRSVNEGSLYDFTPQGIWGLIQQARWIIERCESLLRTLVEWEGRQFSDETPSELIMAVHPFPLELFHRGLVHLNRLRTTTANLKKTENNQIAVFALSNLMDDAGLDFGLFTTALQTAKELVRNSGIPVPDLKEHCRQSLFSLKTTEALFPLLRRVATEYTQPKVLHRVRLFLPPDDLLVSSTIASAESGVPNPEVDIIRKTEMLRISSGPLDSNTKTCVRCGGRTSGTPLNDVGNGWRVFENIWRNHCVCGGIWSQQAGTDQLLGTRI